MKLFKVESFSTKGQYYTVRILDSGEVRCSCPSFIFREGEIIVCKHIKKALKDYRDEQNKTMGKNKTGVKK